MRTLYAIGAELLAIDELLESLGGELPTPEIDAAITAWMESLVADEGKKLDGYVSLLKQLEMETAAATAEAEQWAMRARTRKNRIDWFKAQLKAHLEKTGRKKVMTEMGLTVAIQANGGALPIEIAPGTDPATVSQEYQKVTVAIDKDAVAKSLDMGEEIPWARFGVRGSHLRIR